jgi:outer membrane protein
VGEKEIMTKRCFRTVLLAALLAAMPVAQAENLLDVYNAAQTRDPAWLAAQDNYRASIETGPQNRALLLPSVMFTAETFANYLNKSQPTNSSGSFEVTGYSVQLTQPLFRLSSFAAYTQSKAAVSQAEAQLAVARQDLMLRVSQSYFDVLAAEDALEFARAEKTAVGAQRALAERNFQVGTGTIADVHDARAAFDQSAAQEVQAENDYQVRREDLVRLLGRDVGTLARLAPKLPLQTPEPADPEQWVKAAADQSPRIKLQEYATKVASEEVSKNRGDYYPTVDLIASHNYSKAGNVFFPGTTEYTSNVIGVQLQVPLYSGGATHSRVTETIAREDQARQTLEQTRRQATRDTRAYYLAVTGGATRVRALEQALTSTQRSLESTLIGYESGVRTGLDVLIVQRALYRTKRDLSQARYDYLMGRLKLKSAVGTLSDNDLMETNALLAAD